MNPVLLRTSTLSVQEVCDGELILEVLACKFLIPYSEIVKILSEKANINKY